MITHFDAYYTAHEDGATVSKDTVCSIICSRIKQHFSDSVFPPESIVFVSCTWAECAKVFNTLDDRAKNKLEGYLLICADKFEFAKQPSSQLQLQKASHLDDVEEK